jgi:hypothetical protein
MRINTSLLLTAFLGVMLSPRAQAQSSAAPLATPGFHHLHLNSMNPEAAIDFYTRQFPSATKATFDGQPALKAGKVWVLFTKVNAPPPTAPQTAIWHFGWHVTDVHESLKMYQERKDVKLLPLYTTGEGGFVYASSDTWPGAAGSLGRTRAEIADAKAKNIQPTHGAGFAYLAGPEGAIIEYQGNMPAERFNHVHMFQKDPYCTDLWYQQHLNAPAPAPAAGKILYTEENCKVPRPERSWPALEPGGMLRQPAGVTFGDVALSWHVQQDNTPLESTRGHLYDHIALSVTNLDAWFGKLLNERVKFLSSKIYTVGGLRAFMIEGPSQEALELIEVKP